MFEFEKSDKFRLLAAEGETVDIKCRQETERGRMRTRISRQV